MAAAPATPLDAFLTRLETFVKAGMSGQFLKLTGDLVSDISPEALPKAVWSETINRRFCSVQIWIQI